MSVIGLVSFGETSKKLENGIYHNETSSKLIEIKNDTLKVLFLLFYRGGTELSFGYLSNN